VRREKNNRDKLFFPEHTFSAEYAGRIKGEGICFWRSENGDRNATRSYEIHRSKMLSYQFGIILLRHALTVTSLYEALRTMW